LKFEPARFNGNRNQQSNNYDNKWNGTNMQSQPLTEDSYFYTVKLDDKTRTGFIILKR